MTTLPTKVLAFVVCATVCVRCIAADEQLEQLAGVESFPARDAEISTGEPQPDKYPHAGLSGEEAVAAMRLPEGFAAQLYGAEPDVKQPIAMALDHRGRLWIAEAYEYPRRANDGQGRDRILVFDDVDGDGRFDKRVVFAEGLNLVSGIEVGFGGVYVGAAPYLMFIPDRDGNDIPDGEPEILLDGWGYEDTHETLNAFIWGPDGWLYGCQGVFTHSRVGQPGAPDAERVPLNGAIWRFHPTRREFEVFAEGLSNPWGVDFDDHGQAFATACVIPHLYHIIPGARYQRQSGSHFNPHTYDDIKTIADHLHYQGSNPWAGNLMSGDAGGGHAHAGAMIYLGGAWPEKYRGRIFMNNIHGQRINTDVLEPQGSGFVGRHGPDFLLTGDIASQILNLRYGPDGNVYLIDWYDTNACHHNDAAGHDRSNGRIYKIVYGDARSAPVDLAMRSDVELARLVLHENDWYVRHARRLLQERHAAGGVDGAARKILESIAVTNDDPARQLRAMWALHATGGVPPKTLQTIFASPSAHVRSWTVRLLVNHGGTIDAQWKSTLLTAARSDPSPVVRLAICSALQKMPLEDRWEIVAALVDHAEDAHDQNLPLMIWYAAEPLAEVDPRRALTLGLAAGETIPLVQRFMIQRLARSDAPEGVEILINELAASDDDDQRLTIIRHLLSGLEGRRTFSPPETWSGLYEMLEQSDRTDLRRQAAALGVAFGDPAARETLREVIGDGDLETSARREALEILRRAKDPQLPDALLSLLDDPALRRASLAAMALYDDSRIPAKIVAAYESMSPADKRTALATLCSRISFATALLRAVDAGQIPASDIPADLVRQVQNLDDGELNRQLAEAWGQMRDTPADRKRLIDELWRLVNSPPAVPNLELGRAIHAKTCQQCHVLYGVGGQIGPDITGANRQDWKYLITNIVDPSAVIAKEYQQTVVLTTDGLVVSGLVKAENDRSLTIQTPTDVVVVPKDEIDDRQLSDVSMMPGDQLKQFSPHEIASLLRYLSSTGQTPLLARPDNQESFFNGENLALWSGNRDLWSVEQGEIVGRSPGLSKNEFLFSDFVASDFRLTLEVKLVNDQGNSGIQFRSKRQRDGHAQGYQADIGPGWWGDLYHEHGRGLLWDRSSESPVKRGAWNQYEIVARGASIQTRINGELCTDLEDPTGERRGRFALQLHAGEAMEVRFRDLKLEVLDDAAPVDDASAR